MKWQLENQGHIAVMEKNRAQNSARLLQGGRVFGKYSKITLVVMAWGLIWLLSVLAYGAKAWLRRSRDASFLANGEHDHSALRDSRLIKDHQGELTNCLMSESNFKFGYLGGDCVVQKRCEHFATFELASRACLLQSSDANSGCLGITFVPWENRYELRQTSVVHETHDGQKSYLKQCKV